MSEMTLLYVCTESSWLIVAGVCVAALVVWRVKRIDGKDKVRVQCRDGLHDVVIPKRLGVSPAAESKDCVWLNAGVDAHHDAGLPECLGGEDHWIEVGLDSKFLE